MLAIEPHLLSENTHMTFFKMFQFLMTRDMCHVHVYRNKISARRHVFSVLVRDHGTSAKEQ